MTPMASASHTVHHEEESRQAPHQHNAELGGTKPGEEGEHMYQSDVPFPVVQDLQGQEDQVDHPGHQVP